MRSVAAKCLLAILGAGFLAHAGWSVLRGRTSALSFVQGFVAAGSLIYGLLSLLRGKTPDDFPASRPSLPFGAGCVVAGIFGLVIGVYRGGFYTLSGVIALIGGLYLGVMTFWLAWRGALISSAADPAVREGEPLSGRD